MAEHTKDMTQGSPARLILSFALPLMLGNICQQLYTMVDTAVVGRFVGIEALAALGASDWLNWLVLSMATGFTQGFSILIAQQFGAGEAGAMRRTVALSALLSAAIAVFMTAGSQAALRPTLTLLNTPPNVIEMSILYLRICFGGIPVIMAYNLLAAILRALGDSRTPLIAMLVAALINVALDLLFVAGLRFGVAGAAVATVIAQVFSGAYCLMRVKRLKALSGLTRGEFRPQAALSGRLMYLGAPLAFQNAIISVGGLVVQWVINGFGFIFVAGFTATNKLYGLLELAAISFGYAVATYTGQNLGARRVDRIGSGVKSAAWMALITAACISALMLLFGRGVLGLFVDQAEARAGQVLDIAMRYLTIMCAMLPVLYILHIYRSALQGMGDTIVPMLSGIAELVMRVGAVLLLPRLLGRDGVYYAEVLAWTGAAALLFISYLRRMRALRKGEIL